MWKQSEVISNPEFKLGLNTTRSVFNLKPGESPGCLNIDLGIDGVQLKRLGFSSMNTTQLEQGGGYGLFDYSYFGKVESATLVLLHFDQNFYDSSPLMITGIGSNSAPKFYPSAREAFKYQAQFYGHYVSIPKQPSFYLASSDFTVEFLLGAWSGGVGKVNINTASQAILCMHGSDSVVTANSAKCAWAIAMSGGEGASAFVNSLAIIFMYNLSSNNWAPNNRLVWMYSYMGAMTNGMLHYAIQRSSNILGLWVNGVKIGTGYTFVTALSDYSLRLYVGGVNALQSIVYNDMDEFRFLKKAKYVSNFTIPSSAYPGETGETERLLVASGTGLRYSTDLGKSFYLCQTSRSGFRNHFSFVKQLVINTNDNYDSPQYWAGSDNTYFIDISTATPAVKYIVPHQGYAIGLNAKDNKNTMYYIDENELFTNIWDYFAFPTLRNDEITGGFVLNKNLYVSTRFKIFKVLYVGGNPDWSYYEIKDWGFVPNTMHKISLPDIGEVVIGLDYTKCVRLFDGTNDKVISDKIEEDNGMTPFFMGQINDDYIDQSWAMHDIINHVYRLYVAKSPSISPNYCIKYHYRIGAFSIDDNQKFVTGIVAIDTNNRPYPFILDNSGWLYQSNSGNTDSGVPVNDYFISPLFFKNNPAMVSKMQRIAMYFSVSSSGSLYFEDRINLSSQWRLRNKFDMESGLAAVLTSQTIDLPETVNVYQFKLSSSSNTANPWTLLRLDHFFETQGGGKA